MPSINKARGVGGSGAAVSGMGRSLPQLRWQALSGPTPKTSKRRRSEAGDRLDFFAIKIFAVIALPVGQARRNKISTSWSDQSDHDIQRMESKPAR
jgi:hypothetical protein